MSEKKKEYICFHTMYVTFNAVGTSLLCPLEGIQIQLWSWSMQRICELDGGIKEGETFWKEQSLSVQHLPLFRWLQRLWQSSRCNWWPKCLDVVQWKIPFYIVEGFVTLWSMVGRCSTGFWSVSLSLSLSLSLKPKSHISLVTSGHKLNWRG